MHLKVGLLPSSKGDKDDSDWVLLSGSYHMSSGFIGFVFLTDEFYSLGHVLVVSRTTLDLIRVRWFMTCHCL